MGAGPQHTQQDAGGKAELGRTQVTAGSEERQPQVQLTAAVSTGQGPPPSWRRSAQGEVYPHHGGGQNKAAVSAGQGPPPSQPQSAQGTVSAGWRSLWGRGPPPSWWQSEQGGGQHGVGSTPITVAVSTGWGSIPICSRWWSVQAEGPSRSQLQSAQGGGLSPSEPESIRVGTLSHPLGLHQGDTSF